MQPEQVQWVLTLEDGPQLPRDCAREYRYQCRSLADLAGRGHEVAAYAARKFCRAGTVCGCRKCRNRAPGGQSAHLSGVT